MTAFTKWLLLAFHRLHLGGQRQAGAGKVAAGLLRQNSIPEFPEHVVSLFLNRLEETLPGTPPAQLCKSGGPYARGALRPPTYPLSDSL